jgi:hypothetical protein
MLRVITSHLNSGVCDDIMLMAWSMLWNVTGENYVSHLTSFGQQCAGMDSRFDANHSLIL